MLLPVFLDGPEIAAAEAEEMAIALGVLDSDMIFVEDDVGGDVE